MDHSIWEIARQQHQRMVAYREQIHMHPELSFQEKETAALVASVLDALHIPYQRCQGNYGIIAYIKGSGNGKTVGFRADMDALAMAEQSEESYCSQVPNVMHSCGHDGHTAVLLGLAHALVDHPELCKGDVYLYFQPAEEQVPGGAKSMVDQGFADELDYVFGMHFQGQTPTGTVKTIPGPIMAFADSFCVNIHGVGAHAADPNLANDALLCGASIIAAIPTITARFINPLDSAVVSISTFHSGTNTFNILQSEAEFLGTVRVFNQEAYLLIRSRLEQLIAGICQMYATTYTLTWHSGYPAVINHPQVTQMAMSAMAEAGVQVEECAPDLGGEDFAYFLNHTPGCFAYVGCGNVEKNKMYAVHTPQFDIDPEALDTMLVCELSCYLKAQEG